MSERAKASRRIGLLIPSSNTVVEPEAERLIPRDGSVTLHFSRFRVKVISGDNHSLDQFQKTSMLDAALLLADAKVNIIAWAGTAASWLGFEHDLTLIHEIKEKSGIAATSSVIAINATLRRIGATRIGLVTPYIAALEAKIIENYRCIGIKVTAARRLDMTENTAYAMVSEAQIKQMVGEVGRTSPDAIVIMCTNLRFGLSSAAVSSELGIPVIDSVAETVRTCLA